MVASAAMTIELAPAPAPLETGAPRPRIFSGIQPSGVIHLGNELGAIRNYVRLQYEYEAIYCIVDYHALTSTHEPDLLRARTRDMAAGLLALGLDPERCTLFVQSDVPEHTELAWYLGSVTPMGELNRMTQFKEKSEEHKQNVNAGLFTYPILMAADVLLYRATVVPVGDDQVQHLELAREIARRYNARFGEVFPEPKPVLSTTPRVMGLDGKTKMSKTRGNTIDIFDPPAVIEKKLKTAFTDPLKLRKGDPGRPEICNVFTMHTALSGAEAVRDIEQGCRSGALGCGECKLKLKDAMVRELEPVQARGAALRSEPKRVLEVLEHGNERARSLAAETMRQVHDVMGLGARLP
jgi:tryptophanyl-tRNA synthetase